MGGKESKLCNCISCSSGSTDDNDVYIYVLQNTDLSEYYSSNISIEEKEELLMAELKKLQELQNHTSDSSNNSTLLINNHPYTSSKLKLDTDTILSLDPMPVQSQHKSQVNISEDFNTNGTSHQNVGETDSPNLPLAIPLLSPSTRASISPEMDDAIWKLLTENPEAMFSPSTTEKNKALPSSTPLIAYSASDPKFDFRVSPMLSSDKNAMMKGYTSDSRFNSTRAKSEFVHKKSISKVGRNVCLLLCYTFVFGTNAFFLYKNRKMYRKT